MEFIFSVVLGDAALALRALRIHDAWILRGRGGPDVAEEASPSLGGRYNGQRICLSDRVNEGAFALSHGPVATITDARQEGSDFGYAGVLALVDQG